MKSIPAKNGSSGLYVEGAAALSEYLRFAPDCLLQIQAKPQATLPLYLLHNLAAQGFKVEIAKSPPHPGIDAPIWAKLRHRDYQEADLIEDVQRHGPKLIVAVDHITDPRNLGAIVRTAAFFGVPWIVVPARRQAQINQAVVSTSQGGLALVKVATVTNLNRTLKRLADINYWLLGAAMDGEPCESLRGFYDRQVLVLGSEDKGLSDAVAKSCDRLVSIQGSEVKLDSLNVSVAAGILIHLFS